MPAETPCYICDLLMVELPSWQSGWCYWRHGGEVVILSDDMVELFGGFGVALENACEALHDNLEAG